MKILEKMKIDLVVKFRDEYKRVILSLLEEDNNASVLDLGCGDYKRLTVKIKEKIDSRWPIYGIDIDKGEGVSGILTFLGDLNKDFNFQDNSFSVVIASQIIEHLWNSDVFLKEIRRVLKPEGYAIISTPNLAAFPHILNLLLGKQPDCMVWGDMYPWMEKPGHLRLFTKSELVNMLRFHGFKVDKIIGSGYLLGRPTTITIKVRK